jgi:WD40 repeat protein
MADNPNQPREYDAVKGGQDPALAPASGVVLGGLEGVKRRLRSVIVEARVAALSETVRYGETGLDLVIQALKDESEQVQRIAYTLLLEIAQPRVRQALREYNPYLGFECLYSLTGSELGEESITISPDGQILATAGGDNTVKLWHLHARELLCIPIKHSAPVTAVAFSPDGQTLISGSYDKTIKLLNLDTKELQTLTGHLAAVTSVAFEPDGQTFASGSGDSTVNLWDLYNGEMLGTYISHSAAVTSINFSSNGQFLVSGSYDNNIKLLDLFSVKRHSFTGPSDTLIRISAKGRTFTGHAGTVTCIAFSPDSKTLISGSADSTIKVWHLHAEKALHTLKGHSSSVKSIAISPDGKTIVSGSSDMTIKFWDLLTGQLLHTLEGHSHGIGSVALSLDGQTLASCSGDGTIKVWRAR